MVFKYSNYIHYIIEFLFSENIPLNVILVTFITNFLYSYSHTFFIIDTLRNKIKFLDIKYYLQIINCK